MDAGTDTLSLLSYTGYELIVGPSVFFIFIFKILFFIFYIYIFLKTGEIKNWIFGTKVILEVFSRQPEVRGKKKGVKELPDSYFICVFLAINIVKHDLRFVNFISGL